MNSIMETVRSVCYNVRQSAKKGLSFQKLLSKTRKEFKLHYLDLKIRSVKDKTLNEGVFYLNGWYDPDDDQDDEPSIELLITHNFKKDIEWFPQTANRLLIEIFDTVVHELRHQRQYRKRNFLPGSPRGAGHAEYLSDPDEIDAYSISIATELCRNLGKNRALRYMHNIEALSRFKVGGLFVSPCLGMYINNDPKLDELVIKKLTKKIYVRLKKIDTDAIFM